MTINCVSVNDIPSLVGYNNEHTAPFYSAEIYLAEGNA